ncbi:MAG: bifunctional phosphopantothenoylcysteine decarboxylase/phosphopantothenate--cysteine ligase CoaBC [Candidatus Marinimicrobia bacterium]|nr:bifunctional phosphopantothenoylcysteine decarboxylase/phosphopantothenate--cysteine ligase CoaBC [Candidatus Neomarinimicrobiota bacterium]MBT3633131.1 bifunctional phosphopantothenoylcysteine decarboxylase/phosphopantothenate--cysteine ligase CoaBC [Candidatus Neomarinimicrobiota bacterium]MBT3682268.1 bifunctional phosphopantothenoylcysteine decarboxylase/phosphopantothenate--cysteine ligase CoaBC [Candidatus Neomarinimicrobiota bacterium]MBT3758731.1 bifunctional phosphopantothenoylcystei
MIDQNITSSVLRKKNILICITGSIAAYKSCEIIRFLRKENANIWVAMTKSAQKFVGKATFAALSANEVLTDIFPDTPKAGLEHIELSHTMDGIIILPATANILGKAANGVADDLVSTLLSVCEQPTLFVPAMNSRMWENPATMDAISKLKNREKAILNPDSGYLASLHEGTGRLPGNTEIMNAIRELFSPPLPLKNIHVLVTAGPTHESIDPVRYLTNRSSGKMGFALAEVARDLGADVTLITGPVFLPDPAEIHIINVTTVHQMLESIQKCISKSKWDYIIMAAAPADYYLEGPSESKIKRKSEKLSLSLSTAPDILKSIKDSTDSVIVAFALETENGKEEALRKMKDKGADYIILNYANEEGAGFESSTNRVTIFSKNGDEINLKKDRKDRIARKIFKSILKKQLP